METNGVDEPVSGIRAALTAGGTGVKKLGWGILGVAGTTNQVSWFLQLLIIGGVMILTTATGISSTIETISILVAAVFFSFGGAFVTILATAGAVMTGEYIAAGAFGIVSILLVGFFIFSRWALA